MNTVDFQRSDPSGASAWADDTIAAVSTPPGEGAIGIVRMSGPLALPILGKIFRTPGGNTRLDFESHRMTYGRIADEEGRVLDEVLALFMKAPRTYTREDVVEIHCHGGPAAVEEILQILIANGARPADPGEFTFRAFLNGRLDLTQAEAVIDVIQARTKKSLLNASAQLGGGLGRRIGQIRDRLIQLLADVEAHIDFPEEDIPGQDIEIYRKICRSIRSQTLSLVQTYHGGRMLREGAAVAIVGRPNVGKSSLLNVLLAEERAIVADLPGTTRDTIEESVIIAGVPVRLIDTAGIRQSHDLAEAEGVRRSRRAMENAELVLLVLDRSEPLHSSDVELLNGIRNRPALLVLNKSDLPAAFSTNSLPAELPSIEISARTGLGIDRLRLSLQKMILGNASTTETVMITRIRQKTALESALKALETFLLNLERNEPPEILALDLRDALDGFDDILGITTPEDVLHILFQTFCIGK